MGSWNGPRYAAMQATRDKGRTYQWMVFPMPRGNAVACFRGPFAGQRARRRARRLSRRAAR